MANFKVHLVADATVGVTLNVLKQAAQKTVHPSRRFNWGELIVWGGIGAAVASIPDWLEPALGPRHRSFFHSITIAGLIILSMFSLHKSRRLLREDRELLELSGWAYLWHLALDFITPFGLPVIW